MAGVFPLLKNVAIVLVHPKYPENIGAAARIALNMGVARLLVVCEDRPDVERMLPCATHNAKEIIEAIEYYTDLSMALAEFALAVGTTARVGRKRLVAASPREVVRQIVPLLRENQVAFVFGPESRGLTNEEMECCSLLTTIPTAQFSSINLAQAVGLISYELYLVVQEVGEEKEVPFFRPRLATIEEQESMHQEMAPILARLDDMSEQKQIGVRSMKVRKFFGRMSLQAKETRLVSECCRRMLQVMESTDLSGR